MKGDVSLGKNFVNLITSSIWISIKSFSEARGFLPVLCYDLGESTQQARQQLRPKPKSFGLGVEANLDFCEKSFFSQCSNIRKQGVYVQVTIEE